MAVEKAIHVIVFGLVLIGLFTISGWMSYVYLKHDVILEVASITLSWGLILLILYLSFRRLKWDWWS